PCGRRRVRNGRHGVSSWPRTSPQPVSASRAKKGCLLFRGFLFRRGERGFEGHRRILPPDPDFHMVASGVLLHGVVEIVADPDVMLAELYDHIAAPQAASLGRTAGAHGADRITGLFAGEIGDTAE